MDEAAQRTGLIFRLGRMMGRGGHGPAQADLPGRTSLPPVSAATAYFHVLTAQGRVLSLKGDAPAWLVSAASLDPCVAIVAVIPAARPQACLLLSPDGRAFEVNGDSAPGFAASAKALQTDTAGVVRLRHPLISNHFLTADLAGELRFDGNGETTQATFTLAPLSPPDLPAPLQAAASEIGRATAAGLRAEPLLASLRTGALRPDLAGPMVRLLPEEELVELARHLMERPDELKLLQRALPEDDWVCVYLPALAKWQAERSTPPSGIIRSPASDEALLLPAGELPRMKPAGFILQSFARRQVLPRRTACVLASARNEGAYLLDWISYHLSIGFEHIFIYTNENTDGSDALLTLLAKQGVITWIRNECGREMGAQLKAYTHALMMLTQDLDYRWMAVIDLDEYVGFDSTMFDNLTDFIGLQESQAVDAIALCWLLFAGLPDDRWSEDSTLKRFVRRDRSINQHVKSVIKPRMFWYTQPHYPTAVLNGNFDYRTPAGRLHHHPGVTDRIPAFAETPAAKEAWINHYILRSADEALWKWARGQGDLPANHHTTRRSLDFIAGNFLGLARPEYLVEDRRIIDCTRGQQALLEQMLSLPGVAECDGEIKKSFAEKLSSNTQLFLSTPLPPDASSSVVAFRQLVADQRA